MGHEAQMSILAGHVVGVIIWVGAMMGLATTLTAHGRAGSSAKEALSPLAKSMARVMDIGALLAIAGGVGYLMVTRHLGEAWALKNGWFHAKLALVLILLAGHGFVRMRAGRAARGEAKGPPRIFHSLIGLLVIAIVGLAIIKPF